MAGVVVRGSYEMINEVCRLLSEQHFVYEKVSAREIFSLQKNIPIPRRQDPSSSVTEKSPNAQVNPFPTFSSKKSNSNYQ
jgi:hypothetical protein